MRNESHWPLKCQMIQCWYHIIKGWPKQRGKCPENLKFFWNYQDELSILDGLILQGTHMVIPNQCRNEILNQLHEGHFGIDRTKTESP